MRGHAGSLDGTLVGVRVTESTMPHPRVDAARGVAMVLWLAITAGVPSLANAQATPTPSQAEVQVPATETAPAASNLNATGTPITAGAPTSAQRAPTTSSTPWRSPTWDAEHYSNAPRQRHRRRIGLLIAGLAVFGGGYVGSVGTYAVSSNRHKPTLLIPVAGPWIALSTLPWDTVNKTLRPLEQAAIVVQGLAQATGLVLSIIGIARYSASLHEVDASARSAPSVEFGLLPAPGGPHAVLRVQL